METKKAIRKRIFSLRAEHSDRQIEQMSRVITDQVLQLPAFREHDQILAYVDYNHEVITRYIIEEAWKLGKQVAVPKVFGKEMRFFKIDDFSPLQPGYYGIPEPEKGEAVTLENALMIMPGVAFTGKLERVGYGGGFYDRYLETHTGICKVALAFEFQLVDEVPTEPTDIFPDYLVTERRIYKR